MVDGSREVTGQQRYLMGRQLLNSVRALWIVALLDDGKRYRLITSRRFPTVEATATDEAPDDETVMTELLSVDDLRHRCDLIIQDSTKLIISSSDVVSVLILPGVNDNEIATGTAVLLSEMLCRWISPYVSELDENQFWSISVPLSLVFFKTMPFGEYFDDEPLTEVYNELIQRTSLPKMEVAVIRTESVIIKEQTSCWFEQDLTPIGFRQAGAIYYQGPASAGSTLQIAFHQNPHLKQLKLHEKASLENTLDKYVITFSPSNQMPMLVAKYDWMNPEVPVDKYRFCIDSVKKDDTSLRATLEVTFSRFVQHVEVLLELESDAIVERSNSEVQVRPINEKINEFRWSIGTVLTNGTILKKIQWSSKRRSLPKDRFIEIRCTSNPNLELSESNEQAGYSNSNSSQNLYRLKFKSSNNDRKEGSEPQ